MEYTENDALNKIFSGMSNAKVKAAENIKAERERIREEEEKRKKTKMDVLLEAAMAEEKTEAKERADLVEEEGEQRGSNEKPPQSYFSETQPRTSRFDDAKFPPVDLKRYADTAKSSVIKTTTEPIRVVIKEPKREYSERQVETNHQIKTAQQQQAVAWHSDDYLDIHRQQKETVPFDEIAPPDFITSVAAEPVPEEKYEVFVPSVSAECQNATQKTMCEAKEAKGAAQKQLVQTEPPAPTAPAVQSVQQTSIKQSVSPISALRDEIESQSSKPQPQPPAANTTSSAQTSNRVDANETKQKQLSVLSYTPLATDRGRRYAPAVKPTNAYAANVFISAAYRKNTKMGSYCVIVDMGEKVYTSSLAGKTEDEYEYAFAGAISALETVMSNKVKEATFYVAEPYNTILQQNSYGLLFGYAETRAKYIETARKAVMLAYIAFNSATVDSDYQKLSKQIADTFAGH